MIDKRGKELLAELRESTPEPAPDPHRSVFTEREGYRRALERIEHVAKHGLTADRKPMTAEAKVAAILAITEGVLK